MDYVYGLGLIGEESAGNYFSYHFDYRGSTIAITNITGQLLDIVQYSPFGVVLSQPIFDTPFLFNGLYGVMTDGNRLNYMRARYYSPEIRRFVNQDVLLGNIIDGQSLNRFAFVMGNPVIGVDPEGRWVWWLVGIGAWVATEVIVPSFVQEAEFDSGEVIPSSFPDVIPIVAVAGKSVSQLFMCRHINATASNQVIAGITINEANDLVDIYRGVSQYHPGLLDAMQGIARPRGGSATIYEHNFGNNFSEYTSWTLNLIVAKNNAIKNGSGGIVLHKQVRPNDIIISSDKFGESEVLLEGIVKNANVFYCNECF